MDGMNLFTGLIPLIVPMLIFGVKQLIPKIPKPFLPILAPILGAALEIINHFATGAGTGMVMGAVLGGAGVAVREIIDQLKKAA